MRAVLAKHPVGAAAVGLHEGGTLLIAAAEPGGRSIPLLAMSGMALTTLHDPMRRNGGPAGRSSIQVRNNVQREVPIVGQREPRRARIMLMPTVNIAGTRHLLRGDGEGDRAELLLSGRVEVAAGGHSERGRDC